MQLSALPGPRGESTTSPDSLGALGALLKVLGQSLSFFWAGGVELSSLFFSSLHWTVD